MTDRTIRLCLWLTSGVLGSLSTLVGAYALTHRISMPVRLDFRPTQIHSKPLASTNKLPVLAEKDFKFVWGKKIQQDLMPPKTIAKDLEAVAVTQPVVRKVELRVQLIATLVDADPTYARAWILHNGKKKTVMVGDQLDDQSGQPTVTAIGDGSVEIRLGEQSQSFALAPNVLLAGSGSPLEQGTADGQ